MPANGRWDLIRRLKVKVHAYAQPNRLTTTVPSNTAMCFHFKLLHLSYHEEDIRNADRNIDKLTDSFIYRIRDTGKNAGVLGRIMYYCHRVSTQLLLTLWRRIFFFKF